MNKDTENKMEMEKKQSENGGEKKAGKKKMQAEIFEYLKIILVVGVIVLIINNVFIINARIPSESMENTIMKGDQLFGNRLAYKDKDPQRYDIVIFKYPDNPKQLFIKRVIGLPGETVRIEDGEVYINDDPTPLDDSFLPEEMEGDYGPYEVPEGCYFMLGDNRNWSNDSRFWSNTYVRRDQILAKAAVRYWPLTRISLIE